MIKRIKLQSTVIALTQSSAKRLMIVAGATSPMMTNIPMLAPNSTPMLLISISSFPGPPNRYWAVVC